MAYLFNKVFYDDFSRANENPLSAANWTPNTGSFPQLQVVNHACFSTAVSGSSGTEFYAGSSKLTNDQYVKVTVGNSILPGSEIDVFVRSTLDAITGYYSAGVVVNSDQSGTVFILKQGGQIGSNVTVTKVKTGDVLTLGAVGTTVFLLYNGIQLISGTDASFISGNVGMDIFASVNISDVSVSYFETGNVILETAYSEPDDRKFVPYPNAAELNQGTYLYDVPAPDSRAAGAPVDSRASKPVDSRASKPTNSRTPGTFGPGE